ncbi:lectin C-type domain protein [Ostertagia ostertagi]
MVLAYVHCYVLLLWTLYPVCHSAIDYDTVKRAKNGAWVALRDGVDEAVIKVAKMSDVGDSFDKAEAFCKQDDSHLTSVHSENEMEFIGELVMRVMKMRSGTDAADVRVLTGLRREEGALKWTDGSPTDFVRESYKDLKAGKDGSKCHYVSFLFV